MKAIDTFKDIKLAIFFWGSIIWLILSIPILDMVLSHSIYLGYYETFIRNCDMSFTDILVIITGGGNQNDLLYFLITFLIVTTIQIYSCRGRTKNQEIYCSFIAICCLVSISIIISFIVHYLGLYSSDITFFLLIITYIVLTVIYMFLFLTIWAVFASEKSILFLKKSHLCYMLIPFVTSLFIYRFCLICLFVFNDVPDFLREHHEAERIKAVVTYKGNFIDRGRSRIYKALINDTIVYAIDKQELDKERLTININDTIEMTRMKGVFGYPEYSYILAVHPYNKEKTEHIKEETINREYINNKQLLIDDLNSQVTLADNSKGHIYIEFSLSSPLMFANDIKILSGNKKVKDEFIKFISNLNNCGKVSESGKYVLYCEFDKGEIHKAEMTKTD